MGEDGINSMATTKNSNLHGAKRAKNDEFYTRLEDIEAEVRHYHDPVIPGLGTSPKRNPFRGATVYMNCDDPQWSNFWRFFALKFDELEIGRLISTHYEIDGSPSYAMFLERDANGVMIDHGRDETGVPMGRVEQLTGNGDFRSEECVELLKQSDIVVTNPPFSLFREYVAQLMEYEKKFLIIGSKNAITYKEIFPLIKDLRMWIGSRPFAGGMWFEVPKGSKVDKVVDGKDMGNVPACWFTNLDHKKRHEELELYRQYAKTPEEYPKYDNYDAIEVSKVKNIPEDYDGVMGVPITFLDKFNPDQFEIVGGTANGQVPDFMKKSHHKKHNEPWSGGRRVYQRILIKRK